MKIDLSAKTAIVTGSTAGIGLAIAKSLAISGANVVVSGRSKIAVDKAIGEICALRPRGLVMGHAGDLGSAEGCAELVSAYPDCDILINNVGIYGPQEFFEASDELWEKLFQVNVMSGVRLSRAYLPGMGTRDWGRVIFISSESGLNIPADSIHYAFTKTGVMAIARGLAKRMAGTGVTVNSVLPGPTVSEGVAAMLNADANSGPSVTALTTDFVLRSRPSSIIRRAATCEEVANMVTYACSMQASATTGASLRVEGGIVDYI